METSHKLKLRICVQNTRPVLPKSAHVMKNKERLRNYPRLEEILAREISTKCSLVSWIEPWTNERDVSGTIGDTQIRYIDKIIVAYQ